MNIETFANIESVMNQHPYITIAVVISMLILKGIALWKSARANKPYWFVALLVINIFGIPEMLYIAFFAPKHESEIAQ